MKIDFDKIVLSNDEIRTLRKLKLNVFMEIDKAHESAFIENEFINRNFIGQDTMGSPLYDNTVCLSDRGYRYKLWCARVKKEKRKANLKTNIALITSIAAVIISAVSLYRTF